MPVQGDQDGVLTLGQPALAEEGRPGAGGEGAQAGQQEAGAAFEGRSAAAFGVEDLQAAGPGGPAPGEVEGWAFGAGARPGISAP
ncbi:hypothetical protein OU787_01645 [Kitasatospora sp. YST-16]|uniref:hypothetical protein n=1 Tax=Kitasatospora sp. YST-16 TaxID=2998080 RepID=UPI00228475FC|nr:hypothetical protein [Kitasatospora sp. YST-16]WAL70305.1 hypothetical protein OU787_01645 [Kitasatospora sp. YST-16]WNW36347.1 hypothetical protein RKE32_01660 [Streptomyces sp. Li-HN-5-13]